MCSYKANVKTELLSFACRHHIMELIISTVFEICITVKSAPEVALFKRFQEYWSFIDRDKYATGISFDDVSNLVEDKKQGTINYAKKYLEEQR